MLRRDDGRTRAELAHVLDRNDDLQVERLPHAGVHELDLAPAAGDEAADLRHRSLRRRQRDALERALDETLEPLERQRQMSSALRSRDRVHLVEDDRLDAAQRLARLRGQEQKERLRRGDEDVRGVRSIRRRSSAGVSPVRTPTESFESSPASGLRRFRSMS